LYVNVNVTVAAPQRAGFITMLPDLVIPRPATVNQGFAAGETVPELAVAQVGGDGMAKLYNGSARTVQPIAFAAG
jgi:hypothetical protein